jgi:hypothetical protein
MVDQPADPAGEPPRHCALINLGRASAYFRL